MELKDIKHELKVVVDVADEIKGVHSRVADKCKISSFYSQKIRNQSQPKTDDEFNRTLLLKMIKHYRKELQAYSKKIESIKTQ